MRIRIEQQRVGNNIAYFMRRIGYLALQDPRSGQTGYVRRLGRGFYPRFHAHPFADSENNLILDLHFENYKPMHKLGTSRVEEEGAVLEQEQGRILAMSA